MGYRQETYKSKETYKQLAQNLESGMAVGEALLKAGYTPTQARRGWKKVPKAALVLIDKEKRDALIAAGKSISPGDQEALARGVFMRGAIAGNDKGAVMAYRLGQDKRVNMFVPENQWATLVIVPSSFDKAKLDED